MEKLIKVEKGFVFRQIEVPSDKLPCDLCPYGDKYCDMIKDPRDDAHPSSSFLDFCNDMSLRDERLKDAVPVDGTIEKVLGIDIIGEAVKIDPPVRTTRVIDTVCPDFCDAYNKEHSQCNSKNNLCILKKLFT